MKRLLVILGCLTLFATVARGPLFTRAQDASLSTTQPTTEPAVAEAPTTAPTTQPLYKVVRGQEGFWRIVQDQSGAWWFLSPTDKADFLNTLTTVQPFQK